MDLAGSLGSDFSDGAADAVTVVGTDGKDAIAVNDDGGAVDVDSLVAGVRVAHTDPALNSLVVDTRAGDDQVSIDPAAAQLIQVSVK